MDKANAGNLFRVPSSTGWNDMVDAGADYARRRLGDQVNPISFPFPPHIVKIKNESGSNIVAGRALEIGSKLLGTMTRDGLWFSGSQPTEDYKKIWGVSLVATPNNATEDFQIAGVVFASVNITHVQHTHCDVVNASTQLVSKWHGTARILCKATASTGVQDCAIRLGDPFFGPIDAIVDEVGGIVAGSSGDAIVQIEGAASSPASTIEVWLDKFHNGIDSEDDSNILVFYYRDRKRYQIRARDCP